MRKDALQGLWLGIAFVVIPFLFFLVGIITFRELFRLVFFVLGLVAVAFSIWELKRAKALTEEDWSAHKQAQSFVESLKETKPFSTWIVLACLIAVGLCQPVFQAKESIQAAGLVKGLVWQGEWWRLLTCTTLHANFMHIWMNGLSLLNLGKLVESLASRYYLGLIFLVSAISGSIFSLLLMPNATSVGASGGLMGLIGFLVVLGQRRKELIPKNFSRSLIVNLCLIGAIGLVGFEFIDNAAHCGGLVAGFLTGRLVISKTNTEFPILANHCGKAAGVVSLLAIISISVLSILLIFSR